MSGTSNPISFDKQFRCHIFGWALGATLIPHIFKKVNDKVKEDYTQVVETHGIDVQGPQSPLKRWPADFHWKFDYKNINGNREASRDGKSDHSLLNYNVSNHVDFARLYVGQHAAEDITFNGDSDPRPLLCVIAHGPFFSAAARRAARYLMDARDDWAHFLYSKWNLEKFNRCFKELEQLVVEMDLCSEVQKKLVGQIDMWQTIGTRLQFDFVNPADLQTIREDIKSLQHGLQKFTTEQENRSTTSERRLDDLEAYQQKVQDGIRRLEGKIDAMARTNESDKRPWQESQTVESTFSTICSHKRRRTEVTKPGKVDHPRTHLKEPQPVDEFHREVYDC
ncbi:uncharacterized protein LOC111344106 isoform X1 [Stylophora pistillata]|uniref:uncharacterized protein LOC111344106 isoform X1 n=1 Tax=Stylophora pistillata TaxID=50429 RepID=UPI000C04BA64|nr:uncharacterized protein LOC111344106 isoform X1 [Stylophora pistillata]XP_022807040.1 uncharacterized protein LOC111344106 isoform X1 [Stylophora pistillata]XP_022807041.1 uncharacterized protein LOC111344106 isoform X1 [Stylophora pistillata]XP_022807042.1 uncharacterized protein LOC111344106 isoform X1 [Stylophora pistillata]XP_022807043.1 uncharacterized protein LOC111344106 isoform X1 [Stylophora pistillata]